MVATTGAAAPLWRGGLRKFHGVISALQRILIARSLDESGHKVPTRHAVELLRGCCDADGRLEGRCGLHPTEAQRTVQCGLELRKAAVHAAPQGRAPIAVASFDRGDELISVLPSMVSFATPKFGLVDLRLDRRLQIMDQNDRIAARLLSASVVIKASRESVTRVRSAE